MNSTSAAYRAEWVVSVDRPPLKNGVVRVADGIIQSVEENPPHATDETDLGPVILMPGLVNAHTHLEFSDLKTPLGHEGIAFTDWIELVVAHRMGSSQKEDLLEVKSAAIAQGLTESKNAGVALVGEISTQPTCAHAYDTSDVDLVVFLERLGRDDSQLEDKLGGLQTDINTLGNLSMRVGISPHAPYSVSDRLFDRLLECATSRGLLLAMHLAESKEELELMNGLTGPFVKLLMKLNAWFPETYAVEMRPMNYIERLANASHTLLIHGNYLTDDEIQFVATNRNRVFPVFCPRTHAFFKHDRYPLARMRQLGIDIAIGTDSRASNPDLCVLSELRAIHRLFPEIPAEEIVRMGTINGAKSLGMSQSLGSLTPGKKAAFCAIKLDLEHQSTNPYLMILNGVPASI